MPESTPYPRRNRPRAGRGAGEGLDDFALVRSRLVRHVRSRPTELYREQMLLPGDAVTVARLADRLRADGTWPDVHLAADDDVPVHFPPLRHVGRALQLAQHGLTAQALRALQAWRAAGVRSSNWWWNEVAVPQLVADALLPLHDALEPGQRREWQRWLGQCAGEVESIGQNIFWTQAVVLRRGLIADDEDLVTAALARITPVLRATSGEGIQHDAAFHHHGPQLYTGGYGASFAVEAATWIWALSGSRWAVADDAVETLVGFVLDGLQWALHGHGASAGFDFPTMGREVARATAHEPGEQLQTMLDCLLRSRCPRAAQLHAFQARLGYGPASEGVDADVHPAALLTSSTPSPVPTPAPLVGTRYYPTSDYLVHRRPRWSVAVRMSSTRTVPTESMHGENLRGRHLGDGVSTIRLNDSVAGTDRVRTDEPTVAAAGDGYRQVLAVWNWAALPGTTAERHPDVARLLPPTEEYRGGSSEVGGHADGDVGIALMRLQGTSPFSDGWKAWFCLPDCLVLLGAGISAPDAWHPVVTTIDQRLAHPTPLTRFHGQRLTLVHHAAIAYTPLAQPDSAAGPASDRGTRLQLTVQERTGSWASLSTSGDPRPLKAEVLTVAVDHGPRPLDASYAVLVVPGIDRTKADELVAHPPVTVLANSAEQQSVRCHRSGITLHAHHPGTAIQLSRD